MQVFVNYEISDLINVVLNILTSFGTIAAVCVAIYANKKSNDQLVSALKIQEQSKNIDLFDKRLELINRISEHKEVSLRELKLLFNSNSEIIAKYLKLSDPIDEFYYAKADLNEFQSLAKEADGEGGFFSEIEEQIHKYQYQMSLPDCPDCVEDEYKAYCASHSFIVKDKINNEMKELNYYEINQRIENSNIKYEKQTEELCKTMEAFIEKSIEPLV